MKILYLLLILVLFSCNDELEEPIDCKIAPLVGPCKAYFEKYYFDPVEGKCKMFVWGGCEGVVPFETLEECQECECSNGKQ